MTNGSGAHVSAYLNALAHAEDCRDVVLSDSDGRFVRSARQTLGKKLVEVFKDHNRLLAHARPAMSLVTMEAKLAPPVIEDALEAGTHVFAEKPACLRTADFAKLVRLANAKKRNLMLALANRTNPEIQKARQLIQKGTIGKLFGVDMHLIADQTRLKSKSYQRQWYADKNRAGGGHLIWLGIHWLDLAMYIADSGIVKVAGMTTNIGGQPINIEDSATATLQFENGMLGTMTSGYYLDRGYHSHLRFWGSQGWIEIQPMADNPLTWYSTTGSKPQTSRFEGAKTPRGYTPFVSRAISSCASGDAPPITSSDSLRALQTVFAIYQSAQDAKTVNV